VLHLVLEEVCDSSYEKQLEQLQQRRRATTDVVTNEKHLELLQAQVQVQSNWLQAQALQAMQSNREDFARTALQRKEASSPKSTDTPSRSSSYVHSKTS
jgi:phage shock protein A